MLAGAGVKPGSYGDVAQADVAPTLLDMLGVPTPKEVTGASLVRLMTGAARKKSRVAALRRT